MRLFSRILVTAVLFGIAATASADDGRQPVKADDIKLVRIKAADVEKAVAVHKGKVVILDVWGEF